MNEQYINEQDNETLYIEQKLSNIKLDPENDGVSVVEPPQTQQEQQKQQREVVGAV
jgi:hypothetical protein